MLSAAGWGETDIDAGDLETGEDDWGVPRTAVAVAAIGREGCGGGEGATGARGTGGNGRGAAM